MSILNFKAITVWSKMDPKYTKSNPALSSLYINKMRTEKPVSSRQLELGRDSKKH